MRSRVLNCIAATTLCGLTILLRLAAQEQQAQTPIFTVLHAFTGSDGAFPISGVLRDAAGNPNMHFAGVVEDLADLDTMTEQLLA